MELLPFLASTDEELIIFDHILHTKNRVYHYLESGKTVFVLDELDDSYCWIHFRFYKNDIKKLRVLLNLPEDIILTTGINVKGEEALCIMLKRLAYPNRYEDLMAFFPRGRSALSAIFNYMIHHVLQHRGHLLQDVNQTWFSWDCVRRLCESVSRKGSPYKQCFGFLDGTVRPVCRPVRNQREYYNGHKRVHALKFQSLILPNGIILNLYGSVKGRRHDAHILAKSDLLTKLEHKFQYWPSVPYIYGDPAYPLKKLLIVPFKGNLSSRQQRLNTKMSKIREAVEWGFGNIIQLFGFVDFKKNLKILKQPVSGYYKVATILANCHTALYGNQVSRYFECEPPTLEEYLSA